MWALQVVASLRWVQPGCLSSGLCLLPLVSSPFLPSSRTPSSSLSPSLAVRLPDQRPRWAHARHPGRQPMHAHKAAGLLCPPSRESRACAYSPVWVSCAPGSRSYTSQQAGVARPPHCEPPSLGGGETLPVAHMALNTGSEAALYGGGSRPRPPRNSRR